MDRVIDGWELLYGTLTFVVVALSLLTRCPGTRRAAGFIFCCWVAYIFMQRNLRPHDLALTASYLDAVGVVFGLMLKGKIGRRRHSPYGLWTWWFVGAHTADMVIHLWFLFMPVELNWFYYAGLNGLYVVILASISTPSIGYYWRMWKRHYRRSVKPLFVEPHCGMKRAYCPRCGPLGVKCKVTGEVTARWAEEVLQADWRP